MNSRSPRTHTHTRTRTSTLCLVDFYNIFKLYILAQIWQIPSLEATLRSKTSFLRICILYLSIEMKETDDVFEQLTATCKCSLQSQLAVGSYFCLNCGHDIGTFHWLIEYSVLSSLPLKYKKEHIKVSCRFDRIPIRKKARATTLLLLSHSHI